jgi:hypothetical protein
MLLHITRHQHCLFRCPQPNLSTVVLHIFSVALLSTLVCHDFSFSFSRTRPSSRRPPMFPFGLHPGYPLPQPFPSHSVSSEQRRSPHFRHFTDQHSQPTPQKQSGSHDAHKSKKSHIKKPLNAFMLFMKEQRAQVVQECTLRESAAINQILGRKVIDVFVFFQSTLERVCFSSGMNWIETFSRSTTIWRVMNE